MRNGTLAKFSWRAGQSALALVATIVVSLCGLATFTATPAQANSYNTLLAGSTGSGILDPPTSGVGAGYVFWQQSWTAPNGMTYAGFAYTGATFSSQTNGSYGGGVSNGFLGTGTPDGGTLMFNWTSDCSILNDGHYWAYSDLGTIAGFGNGCLTHGSTSGWNYDNAELESGNDTNPQESYSTLELESFCQASECTSTDTNQSEVTDLSGDITDPGGQPQNSLLYWAGGNGNYGSYYTTDHSSPTLAFNAIDPSGVCYLNVTASGPSTVNSGDLVAVPATINVGGVIGDEFNVGTSAPCDGSENYGWTLPSGIASGIYSISVQAANAGNYMDQGMSGSGSPQIAYASSAVEVDNVTPQLSVTPTGDGSTGTVTVTVGPSGVGSVSCTHGGSTITLTPEAGNPSSGAGSYRYDVGTSTSGLACTASNNDVNGALTASVNTPTIQILASGYTQGAWTSQPVTIAPTVTGVGSDGTTGLSCAVNGTIVTTPALFTVSANGADTVDCTVEDATYTNIVGSATFIVGEDSQVPLLSFDTGGGYATTSTYASDPDTASGQNWLNGTDPITVGLTGTENTVLSGVSQMTCVVNGYTTGELTLTNTGATPYDDSFSLTKADGGIDGQNAIVCSGLSGANVAGADGSSPGSTATEYVDVSDDTWPSTPGGFVQNPTANCGISADIDDGSCAYSDGPSQTQWYRSAQTIKITADHTSSGAPITSITCSGVPMPVSSWTATADPQDVDKNNGMTVVATVNPQGGTLSCTASDSASPADTYALGTYYFALDSIPPTGYFEPDGYQGAAKDVIQVHATDSGSGVAEVVVQATDATTGQIYAGSALTGNPADGDTAYATYNPGSRLYDLSVDPALLPTADAFAFTATVSDLAGNTATVTTVDPSDGGGRFILTPGGGGSESLGDLTQITATANAPRPAPAAKSAKQLVTATTLPTVPSFTTGENSNASIHPHVRGRASGLINSLARTKVCTKARKVRVRVREHGRRVLKTVVRRERVKCPSTATLKVPALKVPYGKAVTVTGTLEDTTTNSSIDNATITVYETDAATGVTTQAGETTTTSTGSFSYRVKAGASRTITLVYNGTADQRGTATTFTARYTGKTAIRTKVKQVAAGRRFQLSGRIFGGDIPSRGAIVQVLYTMPGHMIGWTPFKRAQTNHKGVYTVTLPTLRGDAGYTYRLRVEIPTQTGWGFQEATSNILTIHVR